MEGPTASPSTTATPELKAPPAVRLHMTLWLCGWLLLVLPAILGRPLLPIDETRYVGVAWEMWHQGEFLVPLLNSEPYSHKPPLLFWFIQLGWSVFGVNELWPRLLPALFSLATVVLTWRVGARLFPQRPGVGLLAGTMLLGSLLWGVFTPALMFDLLLSFWVLLATYGLMCAANGRAMSGWTLVAFATGLGLLAKGPVVLLYTVPLALLVPLGGQHPPALRWYACLAAALLAGTAIALAWAIPAAMRGGPDYAKAIFWSQSADRMVDSFAHRRPLWWYLPLLPLLLFPWLCWPVLWRGLARLLRRPEPAVRLLLWWLLLVLAIFCLISGKQVHYLLPLFPAAALLFARALHEAGAAGGLWQGPPTLVLTGLGVVMLALPYVPLPVPLGRPEGGVGSAARIAAAGRRRGHASARAQHGCHRPRHPALLPDRRRPGHRGDRRHCPDRPLLRSGTGGAQGRRAATP